MKQYLQETEYFDFNTTEVQEHLEKATFGKESPQEQLEAWYLYVRDNWSYDPYTIYLDNADSKASNIVQRSTGHCIDKSIIFISGLRSIGIPARIHLAQVKNHISVERLVEKFGKDVLAPHGYAGVFFNDKWTKASPIFDQKLCDYLQVDSLRYNGQEDSVFQQYDKSGQRFMEYLHEYGDFDNLPVDRIKEIMKEVYPHFASKIDVTKTRVLKF